MTAKGDDVTSVFSAPARAMDGVRRLVRVLRSSNNESERQTGITAAQVFVLKGIAEHPGGSLRDVAARTLTTQSTASEVVARLVARGLVARSAAAGDRRRAALSATPEGLRTLRASNPPVQEVLIAAISQLPADQQEAIARGLTAWLEAAGFGELTPSMFFEPDPRTNEAGAPEGTQRVRVL
jgi:DNA-binding MarR family transcriptional regulator